MGIDNRCLKGQFTGSLAMSREALVEDAYGIISDDKATDESKADLVVELFVTHLRGRRHRGSVGVVDPPSSEMRTLDRLLRELAEED